MSDRILAEDFLPRSELVSPQHPVSWAKFPVIDAHNHLTALNSLDLVRPPADMVREMDFLNVRAIADLDGCSGDLLKHKLEQLDFAYPGRFYTLCNVDWNGVGTPGFAERATTALAQDVAAGARGLKVFKTLGLRVRDQAGKLVMPDDPRIADVWEQAGELGVPVLIHTADPTAFFKPLDRFNERWDELHAHPDWHFYGPAFPRFEELIDALYHLVEAHPRTNFQLAHVGCYPENLGFVGEMLAKWRAGPPALQRPRADRALPRPHPLWHRCAAVGAVVPDLFPRAREPRRVFRLWPRRGPAAAGPLEDLWPAPARRRAPKGLFRQRREAVQAPERPSLSARL